jgi:hypothetical protein
VAQNFSCLGKRKKDKHCFGKGKKGRGSAKRERKVVSVKVDGWKGMGKGRSVCPEVRHEQ